MSRIVSIFGIGLLTVNFKRPVCCFLAECRPTAARSTMIGYWHDTVACLSVHPSVSLSETIDEV